MKKIVLTIVCFFLLCNNISALELNSKNAILYNLNENKIIYEKNSEEKVSIASLTKIMTTLVAIENISNLKDNVTINKEMLSGLLEENAYVVGLKVNQKVTYEDLLYAMFIASGADAAKAITLSISSSTDSYIKLMNDKAKKLGLENTSFSNTIGLDDDNNYSTVKDVSKLLIEALKNETFKKIYLTKSYLFSDKSITIKSSLDKNASLYNLDVSNINGSKTGYTLDAGRCLASTSLDTVNDINYLLVTVNASNPNHIIDAINVYKYYFSNYKYHNIVNKDEVLVNLKTKYGKVSNIDIKAKEDIKYYLQNNFDKKNVKLFYSGINIVTTKMNKNYKLGKLDIVYNGDVLKTVDIVLDKKVPFSLLVFIKDNIVIISSLVILQIIIVFIYLKLKKKKRKKRK